MLNVEQGDNLIQENEPELRSLKLLFGIYTFFFISSIVMPQYFGLDVGYDITCARFSNILFVVYMILCPKIMRHFIQTTLRCEILYPLCLYLLVAGYTMVLRVDINAFFLVFLEIFSLFMMIYGIRYVIGYRRAIKWVVGCSYFLGVYGLVEFIYGKSIFLQFLATVPTTVGNDYRSGQYRIMGPCGHSLGYGLVLILFIAIVCIDLERNELYLFKRPVLLGLLFVNVFLTGSRSTLGIAVLEMALILMFSCRRNMKKSLFYLVFSIVGFAFVVLLIYKTELGQYVMGQIASVFDECFGTEYAAKFGVEVDRLKDSTAYREALPKIFTLDWLNPLIGRGSKFGGVEIDGVFIHSIDHYYVSQYIKYAYPGLFSYVLFMIVLLVVLVRNLLLKKSDHAIITKAVLIGSVLYFVNLWWVDSLQTLKYVYIVIAIFYAMRFEKRDKYLLENEKR